MSFMSSRFPASSFVRSLPRRHVPCSKAGPCCWLLRVEFYSGRILLGWVSAPKWEVIQVGCGTVFSRVYGHSHYLSCSDSNRQ